MPDLVFVVDTILTICSIVSAFEHAFDIDVHDGDDAADVVDDGPINDAFQQIRDIQQGLAQNQNVSDHFLSTRWCMRCEALTYVFHSHSG